MEALVALGLASNMVQFVDFASKIISQGVKIYRDKPDADQDPGGSSLEKITKDLEGHNKKLVKALKEEKSSGASLTVGDQELVRICADCQKIIVKLLELLKKLKNTKPTAWGSLATALKTVWNESEIKAMEQTLNSYRQQLALYLLASVRDEIRAFKDQQDQRELSLAQRQDRNTKEVLSSVTQTRERVEEFFGRINASTGWQKSVLDAMRTDYDTPHQKYLQSSPATGMVSQIRKEDLHQFDQDLLQWIRFSEVDERHTKIPEAYKDTFEWIFRSPRNDAWSDFTTWLSSELAPFYWITGKPAAGKSTLMKFLHSDPRTLRLLSHWSGDRKLIYCPFYFWNSGTNLQMSQEGMARTLLYKSLQQAPELWSILFPQQMEEYIAYGNPWQLPLTWEMLTEALQKLVEAAGRTYRLFVFIDGLDEFDGDHSRLLALIQTFNSPHVKTCVSSRPWNIFQDSFRRRPSLRLEDLTYNDIRQYVKSRFENNAGFEDRQRETPDEAEQLVENITLKASGVFLWVALVTDSLLEGLSDGDRLSELQVRLDAIPPDLETLFWRILTNLGDHHLKRTSQVLQIMQASLTPLDVLTLSYADEEDPEFALKIPIELVPANQIDARAKNLCRRLNASCKGLIEWKADKGSPLAYAKVGYLHRTVKDYITRPDVWPKFLETTDESFDPYIRLCGGLLSIMKTHGQCWLDGDESSFWTSLWGKVTYALEYAVRADPVCELGSQVRFLNEIDVTATAPTKAILPTNWTHWSSSRTSYLPTNDFFHLAVVLRLTSYIRTTIHFVRDKSILNSALELSIQEYGIVYGEEESVVPHSNDCPSLRTLSEIPPLEIIDLLLSHGADPNSQLRVSPWENFLLFFHINDMEYYRKIGKVFLDYGANPRLVNKDMDEKLYQYARQKKRASRVNGIKSIGTIMKSKMTGTKSSTA